MADNAYITRYNATSGVMEYFSGSSWYQVPDEIAAYDPAVDADWDEPIPTTMAAALDQLAARVRAVEP